MLLTSAKNKHARQFVERRLIIRLRIFLVVLILLLGDIIYEISSGYILFAKAFFAFLISRISPQSFLVHRNYSFLTSII